MFGKKKIFIIMPLACAPVNDQNLFFVTLKNVPNKKKLFIWKSLITKSAIFF